MIDENDDEGSDTADFDIGAGLDDIASSMGIGAATEVPDEEDAVATEAADVDPAAPAAPAADPAAITVREPPKSWSKDKHELWKTLSPDAQDYYTVREKQMLDGIDQYKGDAGYARQLREIITPYSGMLKEQGISETDAIGYLFNAHAQLTSGSPEQRLAAYRQIGIDLGLSEEQQQQEQNLDPAVRELRSEVQQLRHARETELRQKQQAVMADCASQTDQFASDPANVHFNEVAQDMVGFVKQGLGLKDAYEKAVWANPVTREKEIARRQTEAAAQLKASAKQEGETARRAKGVNLNGAQTRRAPTEPKGKFLDDSDMHATLKTIKERAH